MRPVKKVIIFLPLAKSSVDVEFFETYGRAKTYLLQNMANLPFDCEILEYDAHTFPIDANRNECATRFLEGMPISGGRVFRADVSIWLDTDHTIPIDTLFKMLKHDRPIILGVYYIKSKRKENPFYPVLFKRREDNPDLFKAVMEFPESDLFEVDFAGMGCACIKREVFEKITPPKGGKYFKYMRHPKGTAASDSEWKHEVGIEDISEDRWFWDQVKDNTEYPILVDPTIQFGHIGKIIYDQHMYYAWRETYKQRLIDMHGQEKFEEVWSKMAVAKPYKEIKIYGSKKQKGPKRLSRTG